MNSGHITRDFENDGLAMACAELAARYRILRREFRLTDAEITRRLGRSVFMLELSGDEVQDVIAAVRLSAVALGRLIDTLSGRPWH